MGIDPGGDEPDHLGFYDTCNGDSGSPMWIQQAEGEKVRGKNIQGKMNDRVSLGSVLKVISILFKRHSNAHITLYTLYQRSVVVGHVSRGPDDCGALDDPAVSTMTAAHISWISQRIEDDIAGRLTSAAGETPCNVVVLLLLRFV